MDAAILAYQDALAILEHTTGDHPYLPMSLTHLGLAYLAAERPQDAVGPLRRAVALRRVTSGKPTRSLRWCKTHMCDLAESQFALAQALLATGAERRTVADLARKSLRVFRAAGSSWEGDAAQVTD